MEEIHKLFMLKLQTRVMRTYLLRNSSIRSVNALLAFIGALLLWSLTLSPVANGEIKEEIRNLEGISKVRIAGSLTVIVKEADASQIRIRGPEEAISKVAANTSGDTVSISYDAGWLEFYVEDLDELVIEVSLPVIEGLSVSGSGDLVADQLHSPKFKAVVQGSGNLVIKSLTAKEVSLTVLGSGDMVIKDLAAIKSKASIKGSGTIVASGEVVSQDISIMGSGDFVGRELTAEVAKGKISGSGDAVLAKAGKRDFSVLGSGEFHVID